MNLTADEDSLGRSRLLLFKPRRRDCIAFPYAFLLMILSNSTSNTSNQPAVSPNVVGVLCGALCEFAFPGL